MRLADLALDAVRFRTHAETLPLLESACAANPDLAQFETIGQSEEGRPIVGITLGYGPQTVTLVAGAHADEPVGSETLRTLVLEGLAERGWGAPDGEGLHALFERFTFRIVPHVNPDAEARNRAWIERWPDLPAFLKNRRREPPGRDVEFGYPVMRPENAAVSRFLFGYRPIALHASLHGMAFSEGALLLIEKRWADRVASLKAAFAEAAAGEGLPLHDQDRSGDKGFRYLGPGFWTTPEGTAMQRFFRAQGDPATAAKFFLSSMETAVLTGRDPRSGQTPLCLVTELPLWHITAGETGPPGSAARFRALKAALPEATLAANRDGTDGGLQERFGLEPLNLKTAVRLQLRVLDLGLDAVAAN